MYQLFLLGVGHEAHCSGFKISELLEFCSEAFFNRRKFGGVLRMELAMILGSTTLLSAVLAIIYRSGINSLRVSMEKDRGRFMRELDQAGDNLKRAQAEIKNLKDENSRKMDVAREKISGLESDNIRLKRELKKLKCHLVQSDQVREKSQNFVEIFCRDLDQASYNMGEIGEIDFQTPLCRFQELASEVSLELVPRFIESASGKSGDDGGFVPSEFQNAIFERIENSNENIVVEAVAGSGKSTTIQEIVYRLPRNLNITVLMFNSDISASMKRRLQKSGLGHAKVATINSFGGSLLSKYGKLDFRQHKQNELINELCSESDNLAALISANGESRQTIRRLVWHARNEGLIPGESGYEQKWNEIVDNFSDDQPEFYMIEAAKAVLGKSVTFYKERGVVDYDDQLYLPLVLGLGRGSEDVIIVDEAQDLNNCQRKLIHSILGQRGRIVAVGDSFQSIYAFRGANSRSMEMIKKEFDCVEMPLSVSYRCRSAIVKEARRKTGIENFEADKTGGFVRDLGTRYDESSFRPGDFVICRNNAPLARVALDLFKKNIRINFCSKLHRKQVGNALKQIPKDKTTVQDIRNWIEWFFDWKQKKIDPKNEVELQQNEDFREILSGLVEFAPVDSGYSEFIDIVNHLMEPVSQEQAVNLMTIHGSKGMEAERVFLLDPVLIPSRFAKTREAKIQENNLLYVGITRAKEELYYIRSRN